MKKTILAILCVSALSACDDKLDIVPKGQVTLQRVDELELLLNQEYMISSPPASDLGVVCGETVGMFDQVSAVMAQPNTSKYALMAWDETVNRAVLTVQDQRYEDIYRYVNYMNVVIEKMPEARGDEARKPQLIAEARVMRAYFHWLAVAIYAKQYDAATADTEGGVAYCTGTDVMEKKAKLTLAETYKRILDDCADDVIDLLPDSRGDNACRGDKAWGNAVRAIVLMQMKRYAEALPYAQKAFAMRPQMFDRSTIKQSGSWTQKQDEANVFVYIGAGIRACPFCVMLSLETDKLFEDNDYVKQYDVPGWDDTAGESYSGIAGVACYMGFGTMLNVWSPTSEQMRYVAAECLIRTGRIDEGLALIDDVRRLRVEDALPFAGTATTEKDAMALLQKAKWIECIATPFNYLDMKRWNSEPDYQRTLKRNLGANGTYTLAPKSPLWVMPFPANAVRFNETLTQNY